MVVESPISLDDNIVHLFVRLNDSGADIGSGFEVHGGVVVHPEHLILVRFTCKIIYM